MSGKRRNSHTIRVPTSTGVRFEPALSVADATSVGRHWNAVRHFLDTGDDSGLAEFDGEQITATDEGGHGSRLTLLTDLDAIELQALRGEIRFESIYDEVQ